MILGSVRYAFRTRLFCRALGYVPDAPPPEEIPAGESVRVSVPTVIENPTTIEQVDTSPTSEARVVVIGENYEVNGESVPRVQPYAEARGYDYYNPVDMSEGPGRLEANRAWINARMDEGYRIVDIGPAPGRLNYPGISSSYYAMERAEIALRDYPLYEYLEGIQ